jgi:hypothetical protein
LGNLKGKDHLEDLDIDGENFRLELREIWWEGVKRIHIAQDKDQYWAVVITTLILWVP